MCVMGMQGCSFEDVSKSDLFEGSIIRAVRRLSELMNQLELAAKVSPLAPVCVCVCVCVCARARARAFARVGARYVPSN